MKTESEAVLPVKSAAETDSGLESSVDSFKGDKNCKLSSLPTKSGLRGPTFWDFGWREQLCDCSECLELYQKKRCEFIRDETDTCHFYEQEGKTKNINSSTLERGLSALNQSMPRTQQIEVIQGMSKQTLALVLKSLL